MTVTCIVMGCGNRGGRDQVSFFCVPDVVNSKYQPHLNYLSRKRRQRWITALRRINLTPSILRNQRVCSKHFITGKPSKLEDVDSPDWAPSQNMGHICQAISKRKSDMVGSR
ncbi:hypothetical protein NQ317_001915 [Molorchus minor]|uniref:THAP-type domain-containing protein n=1 Tax=Molorchus minor TaxID=1323400 RepID=A0ABQ9JDJ8_9CUCU|nr:hypothetical protein NQ317_001915 [Molorchus minor]